MEKGGFKPVLQPFVYVGSTTLTSGSSGQIQFQIASNFDFYMKRFSYISSCNNANSQPTFDIQFLKNEHAIFFDYTPNEVFPGRMVETSTAPHTVYQILTSPWYDFEKSFKFEAKSNILVNVRNTSGTSITAKIVIGGFKNVMGM